MVVRFPTTAAQRRRLARVRSETPQQRPCNHASGSACALPNLRPQSTVDELQVMALLNPVGFDILIRHGRRLMEDHYRRHPEDRPAGWKG
jgi:hypothetical protein